MNTQGDILDISSEVSSQEDIVLDEEAPLLIFRVIGCTVVTLLVGFTIIIYVSSGMFHLDCLAQICSESCILAAYMFLLMTTTETSRIDTGMCLATAIFLHFLFISAFVFSLLEVVCMCQALISFFHKMAPLTVSNVLIVGWVVPGIIAGVSAIIWYKEYTTKSNCWVVASQPPFWPTVIPIGICVTVQVLLLIIVLTASDVPLSVPQSQYKRAKNYLATRWASAIIIVLLTASWSSGIMAYQKGRETLFATFTVFSILLGSCIFTLRISTDEEMRKIITEHLLCCILPSNKVTSFSDKTIQAKMSPPSEKPTKNGKMVSSETSSISTSHK